MTAFQEGSYPGGCDDQQQHNDYRANNIDQGTRAAYRYRNGIRRADRRRQPLRDSRTMASQTAEPAARSAMGIWVPGRRPHDAVNGDTDKHHETTEQGKHEQQSCRLRLRTADAVCGERKQAQQAGGPQTCDQRAAERPTVTGLRVFARRKSLHRA